MSHSSGTVTFPDGQVKYFEYNGTCDVARRGLYDTMDEMKKYWRKEQPHVPKRLEESYEDEVEVEVETHYGGGIEWTSRASISKMIITGPTNDRIDNHEV